MPVTFEGCTVTLDRTESDFTLTVMKGRKMIWVTRMGPETLEPFKALMEKVRTNG